MLVIQIVRYLDAIGHLSAGSGKVGLSVVSGNSASSTWIVTVQAGSEYQACLGREIWSGTVYEDCIVKLTIKRCGDLNCEHQSNENIPLLVCYYDARLLSMN